MSSAVITTADGAQECITHDSTDMIDNDGARAVVDSHTIASMERIHARYSVCCNGEGNTIWLRRRERIVVPVLRPVAADIQIEVADGSEINVGNRGGNGAGTPLDGVDGCYTFDLEVREDFEMQFEIASAGTVSMESGSSMAHYIRLGFGVVIDKVVSR